MSIAPTTSSTLGSGTTTSRASLARNDFMKLLVTQLRNQDPMSPLQPHEFAAQLAQFTSVEQLTQLNDQMAAQTEATHLAALIGKTSFSAALIGKGVVAEGNQVTVPASAKAAVTVDIGGAGGRTTLRVLDANGHEVARRELGVLRGGRQKITLPSGVAPGTYRYEVKVEGPLQSQVPVTTYVTGVVDGVFFKDGRIVLRLGTIEIDMDMIAEFESGTASQGGGDEAPAPSEIPLPPGEPEVPGTRRN